MKVEKEYFLDASEQEADGSYDYYYEGTIYTITISDITYTARAYTDNPNELFFISRQIPGNSNTEFDTIPYDEEPFQLCIRYCKNELNFRDFKVLTTSGNGAYESVQLNRIPAL